MIFNIQKCSIHDGSGLRTLVFFKGCPLHCWWCANPESQSYQQDIMELPARCIGCGACEKVCPEKAITSYSGQWKINRELCKHCFACTNRCYAESKRVVGKDYTVAELFAEIDKDRRFYSLYGGGVTFSGGEPLTHPKFLTEITKACRQNKINVAVESCGYGNYQQFKTALPYIDHMFIDIKHINSGIHKELTGKGNELILDNVSRIADSGIPITIRTPVIPGYNDSAENITGIAKFISTHPGVEEYELLPYHNLGEFKYEALGIPYLLKEVLSPSDTAVEHLVRQGNRILEPYGKECFYTKNNRREIIK